jgi:hypothetical protein
MADPNADRPRNGIFAVLAIAVALIIPSGLVTQRLRVDGAADAGATLGWGTAAIIGFIAAVVGLLGLRLTRHRGSAGLKIAIVAMAFVTLFLLIILWQLYATSATHGTV